MRRFFQALVRFQRLPKDKPYSAGNVHTHSGLHMKLLLTVLVSCAVAACGGGAGTEPTAAKPTNYSLVDGAEFRLLGGEVVKPRLKVLDASGAPAPGVTVHFEVTSGSGTVRATATSDASGIAESEWTPASVSSIQKVDAFVPGTNIRVTFIARVSTSMIGTWSGTVNGTVIVVNITSHPRTTLGTQHQFTGNGTFGGLTFPATGSASFGEFNLVIPFATYSVVFTGTIQNNDRSVVGILVGGPYPGTPFTMTRQ